MLALGADPNYGDENAATPVYNAAISDSYEMLKLLFDWGGQVIRKNNGKSVMNVLCYRSNWWSNRDRCIDAIDLVIMVVVL